jgi:hypothetical protein
MTCPRPLLRATRRSGAANFSYGAFMDRIDAARTIDGQAAVFLKIRPRWICCRSCRRRRTYDRARRLGCLTSLDAACSKNRSIWDRVLTGPPTALTRVTSRSIDRADFPAAPRRFRSFTALPYVLSELLINPTTTVVTSPHLSVDQPTRDRASRDQDFPQVPNLGPSGLCAERTN